MRRKFSADRPTLYIPVSGYLEPTHSAIADKVLTNMADFDQVFSLDHLADPLDDEKWIDYDKRNYTLRIPALNRSELFEFENV